MQLTIPINFISSKHNDEENAICYAYRKFKTSTKSWIRFEKKCIKSTSLIKKFG